jgi:hypothetical protein
VSRDYLGGCVAILALGLLVLGVAAIVWAFVELTRAAA